MGEARGVDRGDVGGGVLFEVGGAGEREAAAGEEQKEVADHGPVAPEK
jgi:hypothetical protein